MTTNWVGWLLSILVLLLLSVSGYILQNPVRLLIAGKRAQGTVIGIDSASLNKSMPGAEPLVTPLVEFATMTGERFRVSGKSYTKTASMQIGDKVNVAYSLSNPKNAQMLTWKDFPIGPVGFLLGFTILLILIWMSSILISDDSGLDDPLHILSSILTHLKLNPVRFPALLILSIVIPICSLLTFNLSKKAIELHIYGTKVIGNVIGIQSKRSGTRMISYQYPEIAFNDLTGHSHTILGVSKSGPLAHPYNIGDKVKVVYLKRQPEKGAINTWDELWLMPVVLGVFTLLFLILLRLVFVGHGFH